MPLSLETRLRKLLFGRIECFLPICLEDEVDDHLCTRARFQLLRCSRLGYVTSLYFLPCYRIMKHPCPCFVTVSCLPQGPGKHIFLSHWCWAGPMECHDTETGNDLEWFGLASCMAAIPQEMIPRRVKVGIDPRPPKISGSAQISASVKSYTQVICLPLGLED